MDKLQKNSLTIIVSVVASVILVWGFGLGGKNIETVTKEVVREVRETGQTLGALAGPDIMSPYISWGGVRHWAGHMTFAQGTSTVCAIQSPAATSSLQFGSAKIVHASSSAATVFMAKATTQYATTTNLGTVALAAGAQGITVASTTFSGEPQDPASVFAPNTWFVVGMQGIDSSDMSPAGLAAVGSCDVVWIEHY